MLKYTYDKIETEEQAYWFGYIMADGYNHVSGRLLQFTQAEQDKEMVYKLRDFFGHGGICITDNSVHENLQNLYMLSIYSRELSNNLTSLGCHNKKSLDMVFPKISDYLFWPFVRGYFDGDGCIYSLIRESDNGLALECPIVCSNSFAIEFIERLNLFDVKCMVQHLGKNKLCTTVRINGILNGCKFLTKMYENSTIHNPRKYQKFLSFIDNLMLRKNYKSTNTAKQIVLDHGYIPTTKPLVSFLALPSASNPTTELRGSKNLKS